MKKYFSKQKLILILALIFLTIIYYFYQQGRIFLFSQKERTSKIREKKKTEIYFAGSKYKLSYRSKPNLSFKIADFENSENWVGDGKLDYVTFFAGESALFLTSKDGQATTATLQKSFDIKKAINFKFLVYLETDAQVFGILNLVFANDSLDVRHQFSIESLNRGWNLLNIPKRQLTTSGSTLISDQSTKIEKIELELIAHPKTRASVYLDSLWAESQTNYLNNWNLTDQSFFSFAENEFYKGLLVINWQNTGRATIRAVSSAKDFDYQAKFIPLKKGKFGLFFRGNYETEHGYYLMMNGVGSGSWQLVKSDKDEDETKTLVIDKGIISDFQIRRGSPYWLKVKADKSKLFLYFASDGENFNLLSEINDDTFLSGEIGVAAFGKSMFFVDDIQFFNISKD